MAGTAAMAASVGLSSDYYMSIMLAWRWFLFPHHSSRDVSELARAGVWALQALGVVVLLRYCYLFNTDGMDNLRPYYDVYDDPYTQANFLLPKKNESMPANLQ
eukprot:317317-Prorocentrum_minimum.AAC.1